MLKITKINKFKYKDQKLTRTKVSALEHNAILMCNDFDAVSAYCRKKQTVLCILCHL